MSDVALFDEHGRRIPKDLSAKVCGPNRYFRLNQPNLQKDVDYADRIMRLHECLDVDTGITAQQFRAETERLLALILSNSKIANIVKGVWLPLIMPKLTTDDLGTALEQCLERGVGKSYTKTFSGRRFHNHCKGVLAGKVNIVDGSRHDQLIERMKQGSVIGLHFPNSLQGYPIIASREQMATLSEEFILSGLDTAIAMATYLDILAHGNNTPSLDLAAFSWQSTDYSLGFWADDDSLDFDSTDFLADACGDGSGGLLFLG